MKIYYLRYCWYIEYQKTYYTYRNNCDKPLGRSKLFWGLSTDVLNWLNDLENC